MNVMPWTKSDYPNSMKNLPAKVRNKAIEIGNALLEENTLEEGIAIATAISRAKDWAANRNINYKSHVKGAQVTDTKKHGSDRYVIPHEDGWAVKGEGNKKPEKVFTHKEEAVKKASDEAKKSHASVTVLRKTGKVQNRVSYTPHKRTRKKV